MNDSFACSEFIGLPLDFPSPDHSLVSKFRSELTKAKAFEKLFKEINKLLKEKGLKNGIMYKKSKGKHLSRAKKEMNNFITQYRYPIERSFGGIKRWFKSGVARHVGLEKAHTQHLM